MPDSDLAIFVPFFHDPGNAGGNIEELKKDRTMFRSSSLSGCPKQYVEVINGAVFPDENKRYFLRGTKTHYFREKLTRPGTMLELETRWYVFHPTKPYYITGQLDAMVLDEKGPYILDYKSAKFGAFYYKLKGMPDNNKRQLGIYNYIFYCNNGVDNRECAIRFMDKDNPRQHIQIAAIIPTLAETEKFLLEHPAINYVMDGDLNALKVGTFRFNKEFPFFCNGYCGMHCKYNSKPELNKDDWI